MFKLTAIAALLYTLFVCLLAVPLYWLGFGMGGSDDWFVVWVGALAILIACSQAVLLAVRVAPDRQRPVDKRPLRAPLIAGVFLIGALCLCAIFSTMALFYGDGAIDIFAAADGAPALALAAILWLCWGFLFFKMAKRQPPDAFFARLQRWLIVGSLVELAVAVPAHVISRRREDCCAPGFTFLGIVAGFSVALLSFGPGLYFYFAQRMRRASTTHHKIDQGE
jgi:hypothetical protein